MTTLDKEARIEALEARVMELEGIFEVINIWAENDLLKFVSEEDKAEGLKICEPVKGDKHDILAVLKLITKTGANHANFTNMLHKRLAFVEKVLDDACRQHEASLSSLH